MGSLDPERILGVGCKSPSCPTVEASDFLRWCAYGAQESDAILRFGVSVGIRGGVDDDLKV